MAAGRGGGMSPLALHFGVLHQQPNSSLFAVMLRQLQAYWASIRMAQMLAGFRVSIRAQV